MEGPNGARLERSVVASFQVRDGTVLRLQQVLSLLDYSPLAWEPSGRAIPDLGTSAQLEAFYNPPAGTFSWRQAGWPAQLTSLWKRGEFNAMTAGLVMEFQADHSLTPNGHATAGLWNDLLHALAAHDLNGGGYTFGLADRAPPESFTVWKDGRVVLKSPANTGVGGAATPDGVFPVFARYRRQVMRGTDPVTGSHYADPVQYVAYFHHQDAVHYIYRADYGIPQSLGCIELPLAQAAQAWPYLAYGTLVRVTG
ncbi:MAG: L,D-transpeptidase [Acidimicrobiales bacterium]